eukprot:CAMPEP_0175005912 /NCGR_PEP_ID=MMETSP0005-20121125/5568_1 /TAXON_ID=420556 /ORGANISM="Ochromonas sp., Strain CCMP1393" /LENGTH=104 /DNA_ID=CAMNT_0016261193 /DNA_START=1600 /DNA_END=1911 /DNA_ORIENTATION=-
MSGGSYQLIPSRNTKGKTTYEGRKANALVSAIKEHGEKKVKEIWESWNALRTTQNGSEWQLADGILINLIQVGWSNIKLEAVLKVGGYRLGRLRNALKDKDFRV